VFVAVCPRHTCATTTSSPQPVRIEELGEEEELMQTVCSVPAMKAECGERNKPPWLVVSPRPLLVNGPPHLVVLLDTKESSKRESHAS